MSSTIKAKPWANVAVFENLSDGEILQAFLKKRRIEAQICNDRLLQLRLFLNPPHAAFRVQVRGNAFRAVAELLGSAPEVAVIVQRAIHCPSCGSLRVAYPQMTRQFFVPTVLLLLGIFFHVIQHEARCENCHHIWHLPRLEKRGLPQLKASGH